MQRAKLFPLLCLVLGQAHAVSLLTGTPAEPEPLSRQQAAERSAPATPQEIPFSVPPQPPGRMFGSQLFGGAFRNSAGQGFNPNYQLSVGDRIALRLWGAFSFDAQLLVDPQGNIFIPNIGPVPVAGIRNGELNAAVSNQVRRVYKANVNVYAALDVAQPVKVFVTGFVKQPGLYGGIAADSVLSYLDKAGGVDAERGSYVDIQIKRGDLVRQRVNLYDFLLQGRMDMVQFSDGDVIVVGPRQHTFSVSGQVFNAYDFEFGQNSISLQQALQVSRPKPGATHASIIRRQGTQKRSEYYPLEQAGNVVLQDGDQLLISADRYAGTIQVRVEGAHSGEHAIVLPYGASMADVLAKVQANSMSRVDALQLFRKSVAERQKTMLEQALQKLQEASLSARSATKEEADLRIKEAELIERFVAKASKIEPRGQVVLNQENLYATLLEDGDVIRIPEKTSVVMVHGEVMFPNAVSWQQNLKVKDYIERVGGYVQGAKNARLILLKQNGETQTATSYTQIVAGDEIMVLPKIESKNIEITRGITQILYQIAVAAKVVFNL
ncbi:protein involved in polysaccharide export with SLBB domain [Chromobacterium alkanivorans]|uniref:polysaccharide biosynthesis/export family protein n=1 Tax=Chromobacterium alkanivorans TaxID=1071719 RepID=UPI001967993A|nr:polysaccharide biosynthesis/export family protein [Chromobacterium alkanivorans]MBN3002162.1 polysaccharide export protein [Chromobacterium alkanivorans]MCS3803362.1 protein involved in polysaccharide export with SLBB domain [Chromobacterium alkanivorans]MCS3817528.1 protein involved in polysaccharide export with SLBB domain [Chromobacterium alkanivorans]MCS3872728.1 protein involved in polysaccharide export with SLBB domain [Chromobacterium alkanivorans]